MHTTIFLMMALMVLLGCGGRTDGEQTAAPSPDAAALPQEDRSPASEVASGSAAATPPSSTLKTRDCLSEIQTINQLEIQLAHAELAFESARDEAERYKAGLERAVAELNARRQRPQIAQPLTRPSRPSPSRAEPARIYPLGEPTITPVGDQVLVKGRYWNSEDHEIPGQVRVELLLDGRTIQTSSQRVYVAGNRSTSFSLMFSVGGREGRFSTRTEFIPDY